MKQQDLFDLSVKQLRRQILEVGNVGFHIGNVGFCNAGHRDLVVCISRIIVGTGKYPLGVVNRYGCDGVPMRVKERLKLLSSLQTSSGVKEWMAKVSKFGVFRFCQFAQDFFAAQYICLKLGQRCGIKRTMRVSVIAEFQSGIYTIKWLEQWLARNAETAA